LGQEEVEVITVKIPKAMKRDMKKIELNWSQYIRECLQEKIDEQKKKEAFGKLDQIRKQSKPVTNEETLAWIREGRM
jgi:isopentenyl diphosphate isomerase/L-lactate dehydrogenase-like FMN-dependent dehydrogenase